MLCQLKKIERVKHHIRVILASYPVEEATRGEHATSSLTIYQTLVSMASLAGKNLKDQKLVEEILGSITGLPGLTIIP